MKAISIRQPWAWAILNAGKDIENREWGARYPALREARYLCGRRIALHASLGMTRREYAEGLFAINQIRPDLVVPLQAVMPIGGIVGTALLVDVVRVHPSPWFFGSIGLVLAEARPVPFWPIKGALGFFEVSDVPGVAP